MKNYTVASTSGKLLLFATILASGMAFLDGTVVNIAIPTIQTKLNATLVNVEWVVNSYTLLLSSLILISGSLGDKFGRKKIFLYGIFVFIASSFLCSISQSIEQLIVFRALQGIGGAMMVPGSLSIINTSFAESTRGRAIGLWSGFSGGVAALGPFFGGLLVQSLGWQSIFYINIPLGLLAIFLTIKYVPESKNEKAGNLDYFGTLCILIALIGISYALINIPTAGLNSKALISLTVGIISFIAFFFVEKKAEHPLVPFSIFKSSLVLGANLATLFLYFALSGVIFFLVLYFQQGLHISPLYAGMAMLPTILLITFFSGRGGSIADKYGPRFSMIVGPLLVAIGMGSFVIAGPDANYFIAYFPGLILFGLGMAIVIAPLTKSALAVSHEYSGAASGVNNAVARIAGLLAVVIIGGVVLTTFTSHLNTAVKNSSLLENQKSIVISQTNKLGAISLPRQMTIDQRTQTQEMIDQSLLVSFRWAMGINATLALLSALISALTIRNPKKS